VALPAIPPAGFRVEPRAARNLGDTAAMLDIDRGLSPGGGDRPRNGGQAPPWRLSLYAPEQVALRFVVDPAGDPWRASRDADVLVLGDSFTNIYSLPSMGWGEAAGLVEQLSYILQRPLDRIVQNDDGAFATRAILQREIAAGVDRLAGKRLVIWQFAARELAFGDWRR
jgi:alginate O-acetyltransferase complex protein AlgJ